MTKLTFFSVLKSNIKCALCRQKNCSLRYFPERRKRVGTNYVICKKDLESKINRALRRPLP